MMVNDSDKCSDDSIQVLRLRTNHEIAMRRIIPSKEGYRVLIYRVESIRPEFSVTSICKLAMLFKRQEPVDRARATCT